MKIPLQRIFLKPPKYPCSRISEITKKYPSQFVFEKFVFPPFSLDDEFPWPLAASSAQSECDRHRYGNDDLISSVKTREDGLASISDFCCDFHGDGFDDE